MSQKRLIVPRFVALLFTWLALSLSAVPGSTEETRDGVSVTTVIDKSAHGAETVRAMFRNNSGRPIDVRASDVKYFAALDPSDPMYTTGRLNEIPSRDFHTLDTPCLYMNLGHGDVTVTSADGTTTVVDPAPRLTAEPTFPTAAYEIIPSGDTKLVGPIQHFSDFHCGDSTAHILRVYTVIQWTYNDGGPSANIVQTTTSPMIVVSIP